MYGINKRIASYIGILDASDEGRASILVTNQFLDSYGITADQLHEDAMTIAPELRPAVIKTISETLQEMMGDEAFMMMGISYFCRRCILFFEVIRYII